MEAEYGSDMVTLVDDGDCLQGTSLGTLTSGSLLINIMNRVGYDLAVPGNHDFDYGFDRLLELTKQSSFPWISCNFRKLSDGEDVFSPYEIVTYGDKKVAFVGITTPETFTKSTPVYFQDDSGNYIYSFCEDDTGKALYDAVQQAVDSARKDGADYVVAVGHLGEGGITDRWKASAVVANTTGIDILIDGHSHEELDDELKNKDGDTVARTQTGTGLASIGKITIDTKTGKITHELVTDAADQDPDVLTYISGLESQFNEELGVKIGTSEELLTTKNPDTGERAIRNAETNLGDLCSDALKTVLGADIGCVNGGNIRADIKEGDVTFGSLFDVYPWGNEVCIISASGKIIEEMLEMSVKNYPEESGGFLHVSGMTYTVDPSVPTPVQVDDKGMFKGLSGTGRISNIKIGGEPIDPEKDYTIAGSYYTLRQSGDGYSMLASCDAVMSGGRKDYEVLQQYIQENLGGMVGETYQDPKGQGRITFLSADGSGTEAAGGAKAGSSCTVVKGDCLWKIAREAYGDGSKWTKIYDANRSLISAPDLIYPDQVLVIPAA